MRAEAADGLARLDEQGLVAAELLELADDDVEAVPVARGLARAAVDDEVGGALGDLGVEVVHQHAKGGFLEPALAAQGRAAWRANDAGCGHVGRIPRHWRWRTGRATLRPLFRGSRPHDHATHAPRYRRSHVRRHALSRRRARRR